jgi:rhodanese-related sulfurtransferase
MEDNPDAFLLDVRTQAEWEQDGHLERAVLIPHSSLEDRANELPEDKDELIQLYCRSGNRSIDAANTLIDLGYTNIVELKTGINGWKEANKPVLYGE